jgi:hypothetical protein
MNELIESDEELNAADLDDEPPHFSSEEEQTQEDEEDRSLADPDEERERLRCRKAKEAKINNSFTGPYPLDPTDFNHTDKGPNNQFEHLFLLRGGECFKKNPTQGH